MFYPRKIKGFRDIDPQLNSIRWHIINKAIEVYKLYGFEHWDTPLVEYAEVLGKYLPDIDTAAEGIYSFRNPEQEPIYDPRGNEKRDENNNVIMTNHFLALRYDLTAPLARLYSEKIWDKFIHNQIANGKNDLFRRYQFGPVYRYEAKIDPDRFREFWQLDFDTVGSDDVAVDAENVMILADALQNIGLKTGKFIIKVNNRKILQGFLNSISIYDELMHSVMRVIDKADKIGMDGVVQELGNGRTDKSEAFIEGLKLDSKLIDKIISFLSEFNDLEDRDKVLKKLESLNINNPLYQEGIEELKKMHRIWESLYYDSDIVIFDPKIIRGMEYYTGPIYEAEYLETYTDYKGRKRRIGSICGGGRYDNLVEKLIGLKVPAAGASIGVDRLAQMMILTGNIPMQIQGPVLIVVFDDNLMFEYQKIAKLLRENGIKTEIYYGQKRSLKQQLAYADAKNAPAAILIGEDEIKEGVITLRNLKLGKKMATQIKDKQQWKEMVQQKIKLENLVENVKKIVFS